MTHNLRPGPKQRAPDFDRARLARGFTLMELAMVIVVVGILGSVASAFYRNLHFETRAAHMGEMMGSFERSSYNNLMARKAGSSKAMLLNQTNVCTTAILSKLLQTGTPVVGGKPIKFAPNRAGNCSRNNAHIVDCGLMAYDPTNGLYVTYGVKIYCAK